MDITKVSLNPFPGFVVVIIDDSQLKNVGFKGDDRFDLPQTGTLVKLNPQDNDRAFDDKGATYGSLLGKRVTWAKYAESDCLIYDNELETDVVIISIDKLRGYE